MTSAHKQAIEDWNYLNKLWGQADLVDVESRMWELIENPTEEIALDLIKAAIEAWFSDPGECNDRRKLTIRAYEIAEEYGISIREITKF